MAAEIKSGLGYRNSVHFQTRALALGFGVESPFPKLWLVTKNGQPLTSELSWGEVHDWLDEFEASGAQGAPLR